MTSEIRRQVLTTVAASPLPSPRSVLVDEVVFLDFDDLADLTVWADSVGARPFKTRQASEQGRLHSYWSGGRLLELPVVLTASEVPA